MKNLIHLVRADVRRFRLLLALWALIEVLGTVFTGMRPGFAADPRLATLVGLMGTLLFLTRWLGLIVIVTLVVQAHPLVGSDAFWMTRPISWRALLVSKIILLGSVFVVVPALCELVLMLVFRVPFAELALVTLQTGWFQSLWLVMVMALASTTRNLARFALVAGGVLVGFLLLFNIAIAVMMRNVVEGPQLTAVTGRSVAGSTVGPVMILMLLVAAMVVLLVVQYRTRSVRFSVCAGVTGVAVTVLITFIGPWQEQSLPVPEWATREPALRLAAESPKVEFQRFEAGWNRSDGWQIGSARLRLSGIEEGWFATLQLAEGTMRFDDGTTVATAGNGYSSLVPLESVEDIPSRAVARHVLGVERVWEGSQGRSLEQAVPAIVVTQADFNKYSRATGIYRGRFLVSLDRVEVAGVLPLRTGAEYQDRQRRIVIERIISQSQSASILVRQVTTSTIFHSTDTLHRLSFYLRNRDTSEAVAGSAQGMGMSTSVGFPVFSGMWGYSAGPAAGFSVTSDFIRFPDFYRPNEPAIDISAEWLSHAELVIVHTVPAGSVSRAVEIPRFEIAAAPSVVLRPTRVRQIATSGPSRATAAGKSSRSPRGSAEESASRLCLSAHPIPRRSPG